ATFFFQLNVSSREAVRTINATFLMREEVIAEPPCRITVEYIRTMLVLCFFRSLSVVVPSIRREALNRSAGIHSSTIRKRYVVHQAPMSVFHYPPHHG